MQGKLPTPDGQVADAPAGNWVDSRAPAFARPYLRLSRADRPIGTWLLLIPCWWGLSLAILSDQSPRWEDAFEVARVLEGLVEFLAECAARAGDHGRAAAFEAREDAVA